MLTQLKSIGLADKEAKVYLAMLELGPSPMLEIAAKAGVNRPTAYVQIESLKKMGLVSTQTKGKKKLFQLLLFFRNSLREEISLTRPAR